MRRALLIQPHCDDGCLSAGQFMAGRPDIICVTVFAATPKSSSVLTTYDALSGFKSAQQAMEARRAEDREALALLGAKPVHLSFVDQQYGQLTNRKLVAEELARQIELFEPEFVIGPLGIGHPDHELVREALLDAALDSDTPLWLYEDTPTRIVEPQLVPEALEAVRRREATATLGFCGDGPLDLKMAALWSYRSQLPLFPNRHTLLCPERFWKVSKAVTPEKQA
jgi:LmbE family N-acetylglucosaminyl deacetylase